MPLALTKTGTLHVFRQDRLDDHLRLDTIPTLHDADKTMWQDSDDQPDTTPSKLGPTRRAYGLTYYRMGHTTPAMTSRSPRTTRTLTSRIRVEVGVPRSMGDYQLPYCCHDKCQTNRKQ